ncbi:general secretion pathway protein L [Halopseudomonas xinjiangensis]|uniref:Type II secretion system protein L n=1 Tax=Halopseudomonas xinjiangensis TaxID=487184 RepID=A0A1H1UBC6_9GAMM|nr:type II secretion system protein GspL [Halopseudomonas xinjiangensis]SDS69723.1 general secretion pathway protein L [Halopseudomonas xinjiangensis]
MLIVLLPESESASTQAPATWNWWRLDKEGSVLDSGESRLAELRTRFPAERIRGLVPASAVTLYRVAMPVRRQAAIRAALPFALEDSLGQELEELHFVAGPRRADGRVAAAVVEHENMQAWQSWFSEAGWRVEALIPLAALYVDQIPDNGLRVQMSPWPSAEEQLIATAADREPAIIERSLASFWLQRTLAEREADDRQLELLGVTADRLGLGASDQIIESAQRPIPLAPLLARCSRPLPPMNLLTHPYASGVGAPPWRKLRGVAIAAGILLAVLGAQVLSEWLVLSSERDRLQADINALFDRTLPDSRRVQPVTQFRQILDGAGGQGASGTGSMGPLLYEALAVTNAGGKGRITQFRATPAEVEIELQLQSFADLEAIRESLAAKQGLRENLQGADSGAEGVTARLKIERGES